MHYIAPREDNGLPLFKKFPTFYAALMSTIVYSASEFFYSLSDEF
jgi:hypothetical protein